MGYDTYFELSIDKDDPSLGEAAKALEEITGDEAVMWEEVIESGMMFRWYEHTEDMRKLSLRYPETVFTLKGDGDFSGDIWVEYHQNGKLQAEHQPEWTPPPFDPEKLADHETP